MATVEEGGNQILPTDQPPCPVRTRPAIVCRDFSSRGTVLPADPFEVDKDVENLHKAFKGIGTDENEITNILTRRTNDQRQVLAAAYYEKYNVKLLDELKDELSGQYRRAVKGLMEEPYTFLAKHVHKTLKSITTTDKDVVLLEILYPLHPQEIDCIVQAYRKEYNHDLADDIQKQAKGVFLEIIVCLVTGKRSTERKIDITQRNKDLEYLRNNTQERLKLRNENIIRMFGTSSLPHLSSIFINFDKAGGSTLQEFVKRSDLSPHEKEGYVVMVKSVYNRTGFYADQLHMAMKGLGTDDDKLMRILISRSEIDLENIKDFFQSAYSHTLTDFVYDDTSGDYRNLLLRLVGI